MWIQVRTMDGKKSCRIDDLSKLTKIEELRKLLVDKFDAPIAQQRLFFKGKQLEDGHSLFDYDVGLNEIVQILVRPVKDNSINFDKINKENKIEGGKSTDVSSKSFESQYFKINDVVDAKDLTYGAWFEAKITDIKPKNLNEKLILQNQQSNDQTKSTCHSNNDNLCFVDDGLLYTIIFEDYENCEEPIDIDLFCVRPRARKYIKFENISVGDMVMVNYNIDEPKERGFWYDLTVTKLKKGRSSKQLFGTIYFGAEKTELKDCQVIFLDEMFAIEKPVSLSTHNSYNSSNLVSRTKLPNCAHCKDIPTRKCKICSCHVCGGKDEPEKQIMCDECDLPYHLWCLNPPLTAVPEEDDWYCPECKTDETEVVRAGEKLKASKKKSKMVSANSKTTRDWGKGMACVGRTKECTIVPANHFGPIPGVEVGTMWKFRVQVSESGVHRPHVAGISGREGEGAFSIVLSGGYEDDLDEGEEFKYTGSGGRDLSGNKRCAEQSCDQALTRMNKALALNCKVPLNNKGAEAKDWKLGKPVRVVRNYKGRKHSEYCPEEGNRYDGIYKVVKYWAEKGKSGFLVWRYLFRRDDPAPAPWTKEGRRRTKELGLTMQYPEGYLESLEEKGEEEEKKSKKRKMDEESEPKKKRKTIYTVPPKAEKHIHKDLKNKKLWNECLEIVPEGSQAFLKKVEDVFACVCCQEAVFNPITTDCLHNICQTCLERSFKAQVFSCPTCRSDLPKKDRPPVNEALAAALRALFPGYEAGRS